MKLKSIQFLFLPLSVFCLAFFVTSCGDSQVERIKSFPVKKYKLESLFADTNETTQNAKIHFVSIANSMQNLLTDSDEGSISRELYASVKDSSANMLINQLYKVGLLQDLIIRFEEEAFMYDEKTMSSRPTNVNYEEMVFDTIFVFADLSYEAGKKVFDSYSYRYNMGDTSKRNIFSGGIQFTVARFLSENNINKLSKSTIKLFKEALKFPDVRAADYSTIKIARESLDLK